MPHEKFMSKRCKLDRHRFPKISGIDRTMEGGGDERWGLNLWRLFQRLLLLPWKANFHGSETSFLRHRCHCREAEWTGNGEEECKSILENKSGSHIFPITASNFQWDGKRFERLETRPE